MLSKTSVDEVFMHHFAPRLYQGAAPGPSWGTSVLHTPHCPPLEKILRSPMYIRRWIVQVLIENWHSDISSLSPLTFTRVESPKFGFNFWPSSALCRLHLEIKQHVWNLKQIWLCVDDWPMSTPKCVQFSKRNSEIHADKQTPLKMGWAKLINRCKSTRGGSLAYSAIARWSWSS